MKRLNSSIIKKQAGVIVLVSSPILAYLIQAIILPLFCTPPVFGDPDFGTIYTNFFPCFAPSVMIGTIALAILLIVGSVLIFLADRGERKTKPQSRKKA